MNQKVVARWDVSPTEQIAQLKRILARVVRERTGLHVVSADQAPDQLPGLILTLDPQLPIDGFRITGDRAQPVTIAGQDGRGLLHGIGKFLRDCRFEPGQFQSASWRGTCAPERPVRGIYFASHFHNFYHDAPIEKIERYVEELGLWGFNTVMVWFDMHHFQGIDDPAAQAMANRLRSILGAARRLGLAPALVCIADEAYADSPPAMRADWRAGQNGYHREPGGHYHVELCPNQTGATELMLRWRREMLDAFADVSPEYLCIWAYDQGGCTCAKCAPWGSNGFLKMARPVADLYREMFPNGKVILSTWYFDLFTTGEWEGLARAFDRRPEWVDYLLADHYDHHLPAYVRQHPVPGGLPLVSFPEISMWNCGPWGGFGANPFPCRLQTLWNEAAPLIVGSFPYSEGIYEDLNKVVWGQFYWDRERAAVDTLREYIRYEFGPAVVDEVSRAIECLEQTLPRGWRDEGGSPRYQLENTARVEEAARLLAKAEGKLPAWARPSWRWRVLSLRGMIDRELVKNDFRVTESSAPAFQELTTIYHAEHAEGWVRPPSLNDKLRRDKPSTRSH